MCALTNPLSADHIAAEAGSFEPQRGNNYSVEIALGAADLDLIMMSCTSLTLPGETNEIIEIPFGNEKRKVAGPATVEDATLTLRDYVDTEVRDAIMRWRKQVYDSATGNIGLAKNYKKTGDVVLVGPDGSTPRVCRLKGVWPSGVAGANLAADAAEQVLIEVTLSVDKVIWPDLNL